MIVGLTGGIASGKSFCGDCFASKGVGIVDADLLARELVMPGQSGLREVVEHFGKQILQVDGTLDRKRLRELIFTHREAREALNRILHPHIRARILADLAAADSDPLILSAALLFENALERLCDLSIVVDVPLSLQLLRGSARDGEKAPGIARIVAVQMPREKRLAKARFVIDNSGTRMETARQCWLLYERLRALKDA